METVNFMAVWNILRAFGWCILCQLGTVCGHALCFSSFGMLYQEKSGNHVPDALADPCYLHRSVSSRVARWCIFKTKIPILGNIGGSCNVRCWYIL
jgi:hypothetical protein